MPNYLHPDAVTDVARALLGRARGKLPEHLSRALVKSLVRHFHASDSDCAPARNVPTGTQDWTAGQQLAHPLPTSRLQTEVEDVAAVLGRAADAVEQGKLKTTDSTLHRELAALLKSVSHETWSGLAQRCAQIGARHSLWCEAQQRVWTRQLVPVGRGLRWRRLRSGQEMWTAAAGTTWCLRKDQRYTDGYVGALSGRDLAFWVLERSGRSLALLTSSAHTHEIEEVKDRDGGPAVRYRAAVRKLCGQLGEKAMHSTCADISAMAFDDKLGRRGQSYWSGEFVDKRATGAISYRLWCGFRRCRHPIPN